MRLRDYQQAVIDAVRREWQSGVLDTLGIVATGGGKTQAFLRLLMDELPDPTVGRGLILAHRTELIDQPLDRIRHMDADWLGAALDKPRVGVVQAAREDYDRQLTIATVQSLNPRRLAKLLAHGAISHLVIDEAHHGVAASYQRIIDALREANPALRHLGVTATPIRADGDGLSSVYRSVAAKVSIADLVKMQWLVKPRWLAIATGISLKGVKTSGGDYVASQLAERFDTPAGRAIILKAFQEYAHERRAIAFTASVQGAHDLADAFQSAGYKAAAIDGTTHPTERADILGRFRRGELQIVCNCQVLTEGFDAPGTSCVLMCRPTKSDGLYVQCMGRGLRPANGKASTDEDCLILDFVPEDVRNIVMAGDVLGVPKEQADAVRALLEDEEGDEELAQVGFTFDGDTFDYGNSPMEIIARQLNYLQESGLAWFPPSGVRSGDGVLTVGLGPGSDGVERILAIRGTELHGISRRAVNQGERQNQWASRLLPCDDPYEEAERIAQRWGVGTLSGKAAQWRRNPLTPGQASYLKRLAGSRMKSAQIAALSRGEAAQWITHYQAVEALGRLIAVEVAE